MFGGGVQLVHPNNDPIYISDQNKQFPGTFFFSRIGLKNSYPSSDLASVVQRPDNFIRWIRYYSGSKIYLP